MYFLSSLLSLHITALVLTVYFSLLVFSLLVYSLLYISVLFLYSLLSKIFSVYIFSLSVNITQFLNFSVQYFSAIYTVTQSQYFFLSIYCFYYFISLYIVLVFTFTLHLVAASSLNTLSRFVIISPSAVILPAYNSSFLQLALYYPLFSTTMQICAVSACLPTALLISSRTESPFQYFRFPVRSQYVQGFSHVNMLTSEFVVLTRREDFESTLQRHITVDIKLVANTPKNPNDSKAFRKQAGLRKYKAAK